MINPEKMVSVKLADLEKAMKHAKEGVDCCGCSGSGEAMDLLAEVIQVAGQASAAPVDADELTDLSTWKRRAIEAESKLRTYDPKVLELSQQEVASLLAEPRPSEVVLMKCVLCDQLQADLTARDQRLDQQQQVLLKLHQNLGGTLEQYGFREAVEALLWPGLHSRPEERGTPEAEPCSGCGTPGYTGNCDKCVPY